MSSLLGKLQSVIDEASNVAADIGGTDKFIEVRIVYSPGEPALFDKVACSLTELKSFIEEYKAAQKNVAQLKASNEDLSRLAYDLEETLDMAKADLKHAADEVAALKSREVARITKDELVITPAPAMESGVKCPECGKSCIGMDFHELATMYACPHGHHYGALGPDDVYTELRPVKQPAGDGTLCQGRDRLRELLRDVRNALGRVPAEVLRERIDVILLADE